MSNAKYLAANYARTMKESTSQQFVTLDMFNETLKQLMGRFDGVDRRFEIIEKTMATKDDLRALEARLENKVDQKTSNLEKKMMHGFEAFDKRTNILEATMNRNFKTLSLQIQHLTLTKADWQDDA